MTAAAQQSIKGRRRRAVIQGQGCVLPAACAAAPAASCPACLWLTPRVHAGLSSPNKKLTLSRIPRFTTGSLLLKEKRVTMETIASADIFPNYGEPLVEHQVLSVWQAVCVFLFLGFFWRVLLTIRLGKGQLGDSAQARSESSAAAF